MGLPNPEDQSGLYVALPGLVRFQLDSGRHWIGSSTPVAERVSCSDVPSLELEVWADAEGNQVVPAVGSRLSAEVADAALFHQHLGDEGAPPASHDAAGHVQA